MPSKGIITVAFGADYDRFGAHCFAHSRQYHKLPVTVLTNIPPAARCKKWPRGVVFQYFDVPQDQNRAYKTHLDIYTPYDQTVYIDSDAVVQRRGLEHIFDSIPADGLVLQQYSLWQTPRQVPAIYARAMAWAGVNLPLQVFYGAMIAFGKGTATTAFFDTWHQAWRANGSGREMPALATTVKKTGISYLAMSRGNGFFTWPVNAGCVVQHEYRDHVKQLVGCPDVKSYKPFDKNRGDWKRGAL